jgi:hypothetical protein
MIELNKASDALAQQFKVYVTQFKEKGGDVSSLDLE